jgi:hypothetical protein
MLQIIVREEDRGATCGSRGSLGLDQSSSPQRKLSCHTGIQLDKYWKLWKGGWGRTEIK